LFFHSFFSKRGFHTFEIALTPKIPQGSYKYGLGKRERRLGIRKCGISKKESQSACGYR